ncbi:MAG: cold shock domain-containing protein [bacterium]|nr:cold shock domain-containing protein [bacterium]
MKNEVVLQGNCKWFNNGKAYGIIAAVNEKREMEEFHVHFSSVLPNWTGFKSLNAGEKVTFVPVASGFRNKRREAKNVVRSVQMLFLSDNFPSFSELMDVVTLKVDVLGRVYLPKREEIDPRDYASENVRAIYVGSPGSIFEKTLIAVELPESQKEGIVLLPVDFNGGILKRDVNEVVDFPRGAFVLVVKIDGNSCTASAKKISVRTQDSRTVTEKKDMGEWVVVEIPFSQKLEIPAYADEDDLTTKIWSQIPEEFPGNPQANFTKFSRAIAHAIVSSKNPSVN